MAVAGTPIPRRAREGERVVVLGGTGWTGRHVSAAFAAAGYDVLAVARQPTKDPTWHRFLPLDLCETSVDTLTGFLADERPTAVVNAAGRLWGASEQEMRSSFLTVTERVLQALARLPTRPRFVQLGTVMEYGPTPAGQAVTETTVPQPASPYGRLKLAATEAVLAATASGAVDGLVLRVANAAGPGTPVPSLLGKVADCLVRAERSGQVAEVRLAPLRAQRDYLDIRDAAEAVVYAAQATACGRVINVGRGEAVAVRWLVDTLIAISGVETRLIEREVTGVPSSVGAGGEWLVVDPRTAQTHLGWRARRTLEEALRDHWRDAVAQ